MTEEVKRGRGRPRKDATAEVKIPDPKPKKVVDTAVKPAKEVKEQPPVQLATKDTVSDPIVEQLANAFNVPAQEVKTESSSRRPNSLTVKEVFQLMRRQ